MNCIYTIRWWNGKLKWQIVLFLGLCLPVVAYTQIPENNFTGKQSLKKLAPPIKIPLDTNLSLSFRIQVKEQTDFQKWANQHIPGIQITQSTSDEKLLLINGVKPGLLQKLIECPWVNFIDVPNRKAKEELELNNSDLSVNAITAAHSRFPGISGEGLVVSVKERLFDTLDIDFKGRIRKPVLSTEVTSAHATTMATLIAGGGNSAPSGKGVAWKARLTSSDYAQLLPDNGQILLKAGVSVQNHSYGVGIENYYGLESQAYDKHGSQFPNLLHVFSTGNEGNQASPMGAYAGIAGVANLTGQFKMSKNTLSIGATDKFRKVALLSSRGPAYDGRIKPELVAYGEGGSSESAALVSGISLLVQQAYMQQNEQKVPPASLVKAVLINSADDTGRTGIDFETGFGSADALGAVQTILEKRFFTDTIQPQQERTFNLSVPAGMYQLKATLVWHDIEAKPNAEKALVNDLDVELVHIKTGLRWKPWVLNHFPHQDSLKLPAKRQADHLNNIEQITLLLPEPGQYQLQVNSYQLETAKQDFSLAFEIENGFQWISPVKQSELLPNEPHVLRWQWNQPPAMATLAYKLNGGDEWQLIADSVNLSQSFFVWTPPDTMALAQVRLSFNHQNTTTELDISDTFSISYPLSLKVGFVCEDEFMLYWPKIPGVRQYQLFQLGDTYLEPLLITADTMAILQHAQNPSLYYAVAPVIEGVSMGRGTTIDYTRQGVSCYIQSFLARQLVTDTVIFDLKTGSSLGVQAVYLEKWKNGRFQLVQSLSPVITTSIVFLDPNPGAGKNLYRARIVNQSGNSFYSQTEEVFFIRKGNFLVFPNPIQAGELLNIIEGEDQTISIRLYDTTGRLLKMTTTSGAIKTFSTSQLVSWSYVLHIQTASGKLHIIRLVVY